MRLIDADELRKAFKKSLFFTDVHLHYAREIIDNAPTVERPQGEWIESPEFWDMEKEILMFTNIVCSVCGYNCEDIEGNPIKTNYCPNCGAKMERT